jgi:riboflavin kinase/FMN adenylyltransferase
LTIGIFDGIHLGHRVLLSRLVDGARADGATSVVLTLHPHPAVILGGQSDYAYLTTQEEKSALMADIGVDVVITLPFSQELAADTAQDFIQRVYLALHMHHLVLGHDTALGRGREGNSTRLAEIGRQLGYDLEVVPPLRQETRVISSSMIRELLRKGAVGQAAAALGRWYSLTGPVVHGDGRGRKIDIPTANIRLPSGKLIPANGIYATWAWVDGKRVAAATNIGINPTFTPGRTIPSVEAHLLDFQSELYGSELKLEFVERLRDELKFSSVEALLEQIQVDISRCRQILSGA